MKKGDRETETERQNSQVAHQSVQIQKRKKRKTISSNGNSSMRTTKSLKDCFENNFFYKYCTNHITHLKSKLNPT